MCIRDSLIAQVVIFAPLGVPYVIHIVGSEPELLVYIPKAGAVVPTPFRGAAHHPDRRPIARRHPA
eukprot:8642765-Lingulodinium_polyedra.AAC.1